MKKALLLLLLLPVVTAQSQGHELTFKELGLKSSEWAHDSASKRASFDYASSEQGEVFLTLNLKSAGRATLKIFFNEYSTELKGEKLNGTTRVYIPKEYVDAQNQAILTASFEGPGSLSVLDSSRIGEYAAPIVRVRQALERNTLIEGQATAYSLELENTGNATARVSVLQSLQGVEDLIAITSGGGERQLDLAPGASAQLGLEILALKSTLLTIPTPSIKIANSAYQEVLLENAYTQHLTILPASPTLSITVQLNNTVIGRGESTDGVIELVNNGLLAVENVRVAISTPANAQVTPANISIGRVLPGERARAFFTFQGNEFGDYAIDCEATNSVGTQSFVQQCPATQVFVERPDLLNPLSTATLVLVAFAVLSWLVIKLYVPKKQKEITYHAEQEQKHHKAWGKK